MSVEIYSKMIFGDVIHAVALDTGTLLEGWGTEGIVSILDALENERPDDSLIGADIAADFYTNIQTIMSDNDEIWALVASGDLKNIRIKVGGEIESYPNLFAFHES